MADSRRRYADLRDYLGLLRRQWLLIALVAVAFAFAGLLVSVAQSPTYTARAGLTFGDRSQGLPALANLIESGALDRDVTEALGLDQPARELGERVRARVSLQSGLVEVEARADDPDFAARLANGFANAAASRANRAERRRLTLSIDALRAQLDALDPASPAAAPIEGQLGQLEAQREVGRPSGILVRARPPATPTSPRPVRNTLLGLFIGLAFALLVAYTRDSLDRRIRASSDAHRELGYPVLGRVGRTALGSVGAAGDGERPPSPQDLESFQMLRTNLAFFRAEQPLKTILVTSGLPEEGKTTVSAALAGAATVVGQRTLLVDCDLRRPALAARLGIDEAPGLVDYLTGRATPAEVLQVRALGADGRASGSPVGDRGTETATAAQQADAERESEHAAGASAAAEGAQGGGPSLVCIASGRPATNAAGLLASQRCHDFLSKVGRAYDLVVIDTSPMLASVDPLELIPVVDGVLVCVRASRSTTEEARAVRDALGRLPERPTGIVVTGLGRAEEDYGYYGYE